MSTRVLVTGAAGQVGLDLVDTLQGHVVPGGDAGWLPDGRAVEPDEFVVLALTHHELDVTDAEAVTRALEATTPDVVVNLAAYTAVDRAEDDVAACEALNRDAVAQLSSAAASVDTVTRCAPTDAAAELS